MTVATPLKPSTTYNELVEDTPLAVTVNATKRLIGEGYPFKWVRAYNIRVRSLGGATYVAFGTEQAQEWRLDTVGDEINVQCGRYEVVDLNKIWVSSDHDDAVLEVRAKFLPQRMYGNVLIADRM